MRNDLKKTQAFRYMLSVGCLLFFFSIGMFAQQQTVKGVVKDVTGEPIIGASVLVKGTNNGTITNLDGAFSLSNVEEGVEIEITYVGYLPQIVKATIAPLNIILREDTKTLDEIVVIGYGTQKKSVVTASIAKVSSEDLSRTSPTRVDNALKGLAAGVQVTTLNGQPGASSRVRVRGIGTINNSDPLYIIDGMPVDGGIDNINPADIASIEVLKDAASGAVYGARAANGVVLVTTKKGSIGKTKVSYDFSYGWQSAWKKRDMLNATQYATLMNEAADYAGEAPRYEQVASLGSGTNWQDALFYDNAPVQNHQLSISGASEKVNYYFSLGYYDQDGIIGGNYDASNYQRLSLRSNTMYTLFDESEQRNWLKKMTFSMNIAYSRVNSVGVTAGSLTGSPLGDALFMDPTMSVYAKDESELQNYDRNTYGDPIYDKRSGQLLSMPSSDFNELANPLARLSLPYEKNNSDKIIATLAAELSVWDHLKYKFSWGSDLAFWGKDGWNHPHYLNKNATNDKSKVWSEMNRGYTWQIENVLTYDKTFGVHSFAVVLGQSAKKYTGRGLKGDAMDMIEYIGDKANLDFTTGLQSAGKRNATGGAFDPTTLASYFGRLSYNYDTSIILRANRLPSLIRRC